jgi:hypothetical protein
MRKGGKLQEGREALALVLESDLQKIAESRANIDGLVSAQVEKLAEGRNILRRALEADLQKLAEARSGNRRSCRSASCGGRRRTNSAH